MSGATRFAHALSFAFLAVCAFATSARAAAPTVDYLYPAGGKQGTTVDISVGVGKGEAKIEPWPVSVWTDTPGLVFKSREKNGTFIATIAEDAAPGPHLVRFYNADGASAPRVFVVGRAEEQLEKESGGKDSNDDARDAQPAGKLPAVLNGRLEKSGDVDSWAIEAEAGQWIVAELAAKRLGAPIDPSMQLLDPDGTVVAFAHDTFGLDPLVAHHVTRPGRYLLQVSGFANPPASDVRFAGSKAAIYRLAVTTGPYARFALPSCVARNGKATLRLFGWNLGDAAVGGLPIEYDAAEAPPGADRVLLNSPQIDNVLRLPLTDLPSLAEVEPNDKSDAAQKVDLPAGIDGQLGRSGDVDCFAVQVKKGDRLVATVRTLPGSPIDAVLTVTDAAGKQIGRANDAAGGRNTQVAWTAADDGGYVVSVADLARRGGAECVYRLDITRPGADFTVTADKDAYRLTPGKTVDIKLTIARQTGDDAPLSVEVTGLPDGVTATKPDAPVKGGTATVTLKADADAKPADQPFGILVSSTDEKRPAKRSALFVIGQDQLVDRTSALWLTVSPAAKAK